eukprot:PITA_27678
MEQPEGFDLTEEKDLVCKLKKALYGLKQAPRAWYARLDHYLQQQGFKKGVDGSNLYIKTNEEFDMSIIGELSHFLGLHVSQNRAGLCISQAKYLKDMLKIYGMEDCAPMSTPMTTNCKLSKDDDSPPVDSTHYRLIIGALLYLTITRPDIMQVVGMVGRFQSAPKQSHLLAVKRILRYLKGTPDFSLWYPKSSTMTMTAYTDADWAGIEAEYIAVANCCTQILWMKEALKDVNIGTDQLNTIYCENTSAISLNKNLVMHSRTRHIPIKYHFLREQVAEQNIILEYISTKEQIIDIFTKPLPREAFKHLHQKMGVISLASLKIIHKDAAGQGEQFYKGRSLTGGVCMHSFAIDVKVGEKKNIAINNKGGDC